MAAQANRLLWGWANYFGYGTLRKAYRAIDNCTYDRVVRFWKKRRQVSSRGTEKFSGENVLGNLPIQRLRSLACGNGPYTLT